MTFSPFNGSRAKLLSLLVGGLIASPLSAGTVQVLKDIKPGPEGSSDPGAFAPFATLNGYAYFRADDGASGFELWRTDGTEAGTTRVIDLRPGAAFGFPTNIASVNGKLYFNAYDNTPATGAQVWTSDGTAAGTVKLADLAPGLPASPFGALPGGFVALDGSTVLFTSPSPAGIELFKTDGTAAGTTIVKDIHPGDIDSIPTSITVMNGVAYFGADDSFVLSDEGFATFDRELFRSDGTAAGTYRVKDINPGPQPSRPGGFTALNGRLLFAAASDDAGTELWTTDGTAAGTVRVADLAGGEESSFPQSLTRVGNAVYFSAYSAGQGVELYRTDGTAAGTTQLSDINPTGDSMPTDLTDVNGSLFFTADDGVHGSELWTSDGTEAGTRLVIDLNDGATRSSPTGFTVVGDKLVFVSIIPDDENFTVQTQLWMTDGTEAGTELLYTEPGDSFGYAISNLTALGNTLLFYAPAGVDGDGFSNNFELHSVLVPEPGCVALLGLMFGRRRRARSTTRLG